MNDDPDAATHSGPEPDAATPSGPEPDAATPSGPEPDAATPSGLEPDGDREIDLETYRRRSRRSFLTGAAGVAATYLGWRWLQSAPEADGIPSPLRRGHEFNESLWRRLHDPDGLAPTFDRSASSKLRVNGTHGLESPLDPGRWSMIVVDETPSQLAAVTMGDLLAFPKVEMTVEHKCVEGWSHIVTWGGVRFSDFAEQFRDQLGGEWPKFVGMTTPDFEYFVGMDMASMLHPQTLLCYELQGEPLTLAHGAPLRLVTPLKYGIKQIKRIGLMQFTDTQPPDYWAMRGYDWYAHL